MTLLEAKTKVVTRNFYCLNEPLSGVGNHLPIRRHWHANVSPAGAFLMGM